MRDFVRWFFRGLSEVREVAAREIRAGLVFWLAVGFLLLGLGVTPSGGSTVTLGYKENGRGEKLVKVYSAGLETKLPGIDLKAKWLSPDLDSSELRLTLTGAWWVMNWIDGSNEGNTLSLTLKKMVGPGWLNLSFLEHNQNLKEGQHSLDLEWKAEF